MNYGPTRTDVKSILGWILAAVLFLAVAVAGAYALGWIAAPLEVMSPSNIESLSRDANDRYQALEAQRQSISVAEQRAEDFVLTYGEDRSRWPQGKTDEYLQLRQQVTNLTNAYNSGCGQYISLWKDAWRSLPAPDDLPTTCEMIR